MTDDQKPDGPAEVPEPQPTVATEPKAVLSKPDPEKEAEAHKMIQAGMERAIAAGSYMVGIFRIEGEKIHLERTSVNFPTAEFPAASKLLGDDLERERLGPAAKPPEPMEKAEVAPPVIDLFGAGPAQPENQ